jgi:hypothetical protein
MSDTHSTRADSLGAPAGVSAEQARALVALSAHVLPVWARQLAGSRSQSEGAVADMLAAFAEIGPYLDLASRQARQLSDALSQGPGSMAQLAQSCESVLQPVLQSGLPEARAAVAEVMSMIHARVDALELVAQPLAHETRMVSLQVERMYKCFQYQDRISQMMTLLHEDIERLRTAMTAPDIDAGALAPDKWLARLESEYVMAEQHQHHHAGSVDKLHASPDDEETTFF